MKLKAKKVVQKDVSPVKDTDSRLAEIDKTIREKQSQVATLNSEIVKLEQEALEIKMYPFKIGDECYATVPCGKSTKEMRCVIEADNGTCYVRPYKNDGELSGRRFSIIPVNKSYSDLLKTVDEVEGLPFN